MNTTSLRFCSNRMCDVIALYHEELDGLYGNGEVAVFVEMLCEEYLGWNKVKLLTNKGQTIDQSDLLRFHWALEDLKRHRPIQHIIGHVDFCGCRIEVSPDVLIPRPETEEIVISTLSTLHSPLSALHFLDLCSGSGCIAIALKKALPKAEVTAVDISGKALAVARRNAEVNGTDINFEEADILTYRPRQQYQLIVSNPPYVRNSERAQMSANVLDYDPPQALFVPDDDPLLFYRAIADIASQCLTTDGLLAVEINEALADETCHLIRQHGLSPTLHIDFRNKPRWISACKV